MNAQWLRAQQERLARLGFYTAKIDGESGPGTEKGIELAIAAAERAAGIKPPAYPGLPVAFHWLLELSVLPLIVHEGLKLLGTVEVPGAADSPEIMSWMRELGISKAGYGGDAVPWCGGFVGICASRARKDITPVGNVLWARNWLKFGERVDTPMLGDVGVWPRGAGGHVAIVIAIDDAGYAHILGGNQGDAVNIMRKKLSDALGFMRPHYNVVPETVRQYRVAANGAISTREA